MGVRGWGREEGTPGPKHSLESHATVQAAWPESGTPIPPLAVVVKAAGGVDVVRPAVVRVGLGRGGPG
jgi:hypothetical protein